MINWEMSDWSPPPGHPCLEHGNCDACPVCMTGVCCGSEVATAYLPRQGSWPGMQAVVTGTWQENDEGIVCHVCGRRFHNLGQHARLKHGLDADTYKAYFGLASGRPLMSEKMREERASRATPRDTSRMRAGWKLTPEQRSAIAKGREQRVEVQAQRSAQLQGDHQIIAAKARAKKLQEDPGYRASYKAKIVAKRRKRVDRICPICEAWYCPVDYTTSPRKTCGEPECKRELRRRAAKKGWENR